ncbi:MAG: acyl-CoA dehydrogenase family protein [Candidatus Hydrogenedentes bacterium]|nr:acyl-CoA dehydrogenase family protein [Candidatus Hydrogenedentota bacterium]
MATKDQAMEMAEAARETEWKFPSFTAEMFSGNFRWDLLNPYPEQDPEDKRIGDELIAKIKDVMEKYLDPIEIDRTGEYPREVLDELAKIGVFGMKISKEYGGLGLTQTNYGRALSMIGSYCQSTVTWVSAHQSIGVPQPLKLFGTEAQKKKFLPRLAKGEISAFALTEPDVGSDPARMATTATPSEDGTYYLLNGEKLWCTNGPDADMLVVMAKTPPKIKNGKEIAQITTFVVEKPSPGLEVVHRCRFMGLKGLSNGLLTFNNVKVPAENMIGKPGEGLRIALTTLNAGRLGIPAAAAGACKKFLLDCETWVNTRIQWGVPIGKHQSIGRKIANMAADTYAMESLVYMACSFADKKNADIRLEAAAAKYFCTETTSRLLDEFLQVRGGRGFEDDTSLYERGEMPVPVNRVLRDLRVGRIFEGSSEVMHLIMAREAMDTHFKLVMPILQPKPGQQGSVASHIWKAFKFYAVWYPKVWMPASTDFNVHHLNGPNREHLAYCARTCKRLARTLFHTMGKYKEKLEYEQLLLANFVDIGVDLFVMGCTLSNAEHLLGKDHGNQTPQELADLFCKNARVRIEQNFRAIKSNHNNSFNQVAKSLMEGKFRWMVKDVFEELPPKYRNYADNLPKTQGAEDLAAK